MTHDSPLDVILLLVMFVIVFSVAAILSPRGLIAWAREEWRLFKLDTWADGKVEAPRAGTVTDPDVHRMVARQVAFGERLRRQGRSLLAGKQYVPALTRATEPPAPQADKVIVLHRQPQPEARKESL